MNDTNIKDTISKYINFATNDIIVTPLIYNDKKLTINKNRNLLFLNYDNKNLIEVDTKMMKIKRMNSEINSNFLRDVIMHFTKESIKKDIYIKHNKYYNEYIYK